MKVVSVGFFILICSSITVFAQIRSVEPLSTVKSIESDDPLRYFHAADVGNPLGDINGDGITDYVVHNRYYPDKSTPELGDFTRSSLVYNIDENGAIIHHSVHIGALLYPAGDMNGNGRIDLAAIVDDNIQIYSIEEGAFDLSGDLPLFAELPVDRWMDQFVPFFDFDDDGYDDLLIGVYDYTSGSYLNLLFGGEEADSLQMVPVDISQQLGTVEIKANAGDVSGDEAPEIVLLVTNPWPENISVAGFEVDTLRNISFVGESDLGVSNFYASSSRFFVANIDGEHKDDLLFSEDRFPISAGFQQVFFNDAITHIFLSISDSTQSKSLSQPEGTFPDWADKSGGVGLGQSTTLAGINGLHIKTYVSNQFGLQIGSQIGFVFNFDANKTLEEQVVMVDNPVSLNEFIAPPFLFAYISNSNQQLIGTGSRQNWLAGKAIIDSSDPENIETSSTSTSVNNFFSEFRDTKVVEPNGTDILIGLGFLGEWFPTQYLSLFGQVGLRLDFISNDEDEIYSPTSDEPISSDGFDGLQLIGTPGGADLLGAFGFTVWFNKTVQSDTAQLIHSFRVSDFVETTEDDDIFVYTKSIGDINNDGFSDIAMSSAYSSVGGEALNNLWIFYGGETYSNEPDYIFDFTQDSLSANAFGSYINSEFEPLGDVNNDGIDDFALSTNKDAGAVYIYFGNPEFFDVNTDQTDFRYPDLILEPSLEPGQTVFGFGSDISAGDFNDDGIKEVAVISQTAYGSPAPPTVFLYSIGSEGDGQADMMLTATRQDLGREGTDVVSSTFGGGIMFMPSEDNTTHNDLLFTPGAFGGYPDAVIFEGGAEADSLVDIKLHNPNRTNGFGALDGSKPGVGDLNEDGFNDIFILSQADYEDAFVSSRAYFFSPNSGIEVSTEEEIENPLEYRLSQNYPNPFNPSTTIEFRLGDPASVSLRIFDVLGREVATLISNQHYDQGSHTINFDASSLASGMYIYRIEAGGFIQTRKMLLIK